ncbi:hypothetical protein OIU79_013000 [Salix purpurea]|uniref:Uncharacterized protein n=1 Tax=Salix purpurea TaxID=77065 RepID=A0A9Q0Q4M1_SALPP|nr:hypothetical protein OIU79_013000 [Salix purpurea]
MSVIGCWNAWGLNSLRKQMAVRNWTQNNGLGIIGLIEPRLGVNSISEKIGGMGLQGHRQVPPMDHLCSHRCRSSDHRDHHLCLRA